MLAIRSFITGDEIWLRQVFMSSVHKLACDFYNKEQLAAWAPETYDKQRWANKIATLKPFVAVLDGQIVGYADLQPSGYIDHFFVASDFSRCGVGAALMEHIQQKVKQQNIPELSAYVSLAAEAFFARHGFLVRHRQTVTVNNVLINNALMAKQLLG